MSHRSPDLFELALVISLGSLAVFWSIYASHQYERAERAETLLRQHGIEADVEEGGDQR